MASSGPEKKGTQAKEKKGRDRKDLAPGRIQEYQGEDRDRGRRPKIEEKCRLGLPGLIPTGAGPDSS